MSIIKNTPVGLSDIVEESNLIVEVACVEPFVEEVAVKGNSPQEPAVPFTKHGFVFRIITALKNSDTIALPHTIRVPDEGWRRSLSQHKERYGGISKSYTVKEYNTDVPSMKDATILFLHHFQGTFELVVRDAFESDEALEKITLLIAAT